MGDLLLLAEVFQHPSSSPDAEQEARETNTGRSFYGEEGCFLFGERYREVSPFVRSLGDRAARGGDLNECLIHH